jgi:multidrug resistance efflux pump
VIESFNVDMGYYSQPGQPLAMLITTTDFWIQADMKENNLSNMKPGDPVEFVLDVAPGKIFKGEVRSIGFGVNSGYYNRNDLPNVKSNNSWLRDPQRFPVIIAVNNEELLKYSRLGGQVDVVVFTGNRSLLNLLGRWRLRFNGWLSYIR